MFVNVKRTEFDVQTSTASYLTALQGTKRRETQVGSSSTPCESGLY